MKRPSKNRDLFVNKARVIARRTLTISGAKDRTVAVSMGIPHLTPGPGFEVWECSISIAGLRPEPLVDSVTGVDSLQALLLAVQTIRWHLTQSGVNFEWLGETLLGSNDGGIPRFLQIGMGKEFDERIDAAIDRETERTRKFRAPIMRRWRIEAGIPTSRSGRKG